MGFAALIRKIRNKVYRNCPLNLLLPVKITTRKIADKIKKSIFVEK